MAHERWEPFRDMLTLRDAVDRLFQQSFVRTGDLIGSAQGGGLLMDVAEREEAFVVKASMPGARAEDLHVTVHGEMLTISGEAKPEEDRPQDRWILREHRYGRFQRSVRLPSPVDTERAQASCQDGVLLLTLPKSENARPRRIPVTGGQSTTHDSTATTGSRDHTAGGDEVTSQSQESFPASDAPSWTPERT